MRGPAEADPGGRAGGLNEPRLGAILLGGLPGLLREGLLPVGAFLLGQRLWGLAGGVGLSTAASLGIFVIERRAGRSGVLVRLSSAAILLQGAVALLSGSATAYFAQPLLVTGAWALAFWISVAIGRPLAGVLACAWYPFDAQVRSSGEFHRVFTVESAVWGASLAARTALRAGALLTGDLAALVLVLALTGLPVTLALTV